MILQTTALAMVLVCVSVIILSFRFIYWLYTVMRTFILQLLTAVTATGMITFTVTHMHSPLISWALWFLHWLVAIPIALVTVRYIAPFYRRVFQL